MGLAAILGIIVSVIAVLGIGTSVYLFFYLAPEEFKEWTKAVDFEEAPQEPIFSDEDS